MSVNGWGQDRLPMPATAIIPNASVLINPPFPVTPSTGQSAMRAARKSILYDRPSTHFMPSPAFASQAFKEAKDLLWSGEVDLIDRVDAGEPIHTIWKILDDRSRGVLPRIYAPAGKVWVMYGKDLLCREGIVRGWYVGISGTDNPENRETHNNCDRTTTRELKEQGCVGNFYYLELKIPDKPTAEMLEAIVINEGKYVDYKGEYWERPVELNTNKDKRRGLYMGQGQMRFDALGSDDL